MDAMRCAGAPPRFDRPTVESTMPEPLVLGAGIEPIAGYRLVRPLGRGGFGEVWEASAPGDFHVALKFIRLDTNEAGVEQRSLDVIRNIRHPHLLDVQFATRVADCLVIAMPLCDESLMDRLRASPHGLPREKLLEYMDELARAVDYLNEPNHRSSDGTMVGVQHRDIKPHNIFLVGGSVRLADFGLAKILAATSASHTGSMSPHYVAPEVFEGRVSQRSDQYALAITYYQLRTGKRPFEGDSFHQIIYAHIHAEPDLSALPEHERPVVARALARRPEDRWPSCRAFVGALVASGSTPFEDRSRTRVDTARTTPRHRRIRRVGLAALATLVMILAAVVLLPRLRPSSDAAPSESTALARTNPLTKPEVVKGAQTPSLPPEDSPPVITKKAGAAAEEKSPKRSTTNGAPATPPEAHPAGKSDAAKPPIASTTPPDTPDPSRTELAIRSPEPAVSRPPASEEPPKQITNSIGVKLVLIPTGEFLMGSPDSDKDAQDDEKPQHRVRITRPFYMGATEVTVGQFRKLVESTGLRTKAETDGKGGYGWNEAKGTWEQDAKYTWRNPGFAQTDDHPVVEVSWNDAIAFCNKLSELEGLRPYYQFAAGAQSGGDGYRLPREAEWEYACRAGTTTRYQVGDDPETLAEVGNVADATLKAKGGVFSTGTTISVRDGYVFTAPVGRFRSNAFGLFDMHGNVWEWCWDGYAADYYKGPPGADPRGPLQAADRVNRGGGWNLNPRYCRAADRDWNTPGHRSGSLGFRLARVQSGR
jgi:formylglycine-generating enzyme required for sulfatase activity